MISRILVSLLLLAGLSSLPADPVGAAGPVPGDEWTVETPESHGMDPADLEAARAYAFTEGRNTQGVVVVHEGAIVSEWYAPGEDQDSWAASWSMGKSFASALIGIALDEGLISSIDVPMTTYFPEWIGTPREAINLRHVLHMESGLDWIENYDPASIETSDIINMVALQADELAYAASQPVAVAPGSQFNYSSGDSMLLSGVLEQATGMSAGEYAQQKIFGPIGMDPVDWWQDAEGNTLTYCCLDTSSRDFARFGLLYLNGGTWGADQVVPASWVTDSLTDTANTYSGYGYQWWLDLADNGGLPPFFSARGFDGQFIYVIPSLDLVVVRNGYYTKSECPPIADPNLVTYYPPSGLIPGQGTIGPANGWSDHDFLAPIVESITGVPVPDQGADEPSSTPNLTGAAEAAADTSTCQNVTGQAPVDTTVPSATTAAAVTPSFTG